jgi:ribosomal protein S27AE
MRGEGVAAKWIPLMLDIAFSAHIASGVHMNTIICPLCGRGVILVQFGDGWVGVCCNEIIYNSLELLKDDIAKTGEVIPDPETKQPKT